MVFNKVLWRCLEVYNEFKEYEKKSNFKYLRSWNLRSKLDSTICFWASLVMISIEDLNLIFYIWLSNTNRGHHEKKRKSPFKQHFATSYGLKYTGALFWSTLPCLHPCTMSKNYMLRCVENLFNYRQDPT